MPLIKRYPNRKLYDTAAKQYVTLDQIAHLIRNGQEVQVIDHESGADVTNLTLTQIILEQEKKESGFLPRSVLTSLIRTGGDALDHVRHSLHQARSAGAHPAEPNASHGDGAAPAAAPSPAEQTTAMQPHELLKLDERLANLLRLLNIPTQRDVERLQDELDALNARIDALLANEDSAPEPHKPPPPA